jgi:O-antigen ligase
MLVLKTPLYYWGSSRIGESVGINSNDLGLKMSISSIISIYFTQENKKKYYISAIIFFTIALLTGSRKAFILLILSLTFLKILSLKNKRNLIVAIPFLLFLCFLVWKLIITIPYFYDVLGNRIEMMINGFLGKGQVDNSTTIRLYMIDYGMKLFKQKPFLGYGLFNYSALTEYAYSHNNYVELLVGVGILGTAIYYSIYLNIIFNLFKQLRKIKYAGLFVSLIIGLAIMEYGLVSYYEEFYQIIIVCGYCSLKLSKENLSYANINSRGFSSNKI